MKKIKSLFITISMFLTIFLVTSCATTSVENQHTHSYTTKSNSAKHWKECECGEKSEEESHNFGNWNTTKEPTETTTGTKERECSVCHHKEIQTISVLAHTHKYSEEWTIDVEPTCTVTGSKSHHCLGCDDKADITIIEKKDHTYGEWIITKPASCEEAGSSFKTCSNCNHIETEVIDALGHDYATEFTVDKEATCTEAGSKSHHCLGCDDKTNIVSIPATGHTYGEWEIITEATEETEGSKERECSVCHHKEIQTIPVLAHTHKYSEEWTIDVEPTCTVTGSKSHHCLGCDDKADVTPIDKLEHHYSTEWMIDKEASCTEEGSKSHHCLDCDDKTNVTSIDKLEHSYSVWQVTKEPTEEVEGLKERECSVCHHKETENISVLEKLVFKLSGDEKSYMVVSIRNITYTEIVIPATHNNLPVVSIDASAFSGCSSLTSITIPNSVTSIGFGAFSGCSSLTSITIPFVGASRYGSNTHFGYIFGAESDYNNSKYVPSSLKEVVITGGTSINQYAFYNCSSLTNITIPDSVTSIGYYAFYGCNSLTSIVIPNSITSIGSYAFYGWSSLINVYYEGTIENWCNITFSDTSNPMYYASHFYIRNSNNEWEEVTSIEIPNTITEIGDYQFCGFNNVSSITIPSSVTSIGNYAFSNCYRLVEIYNLSSLNITMGSSSNGDIGYYAKVIHTSLEEKSNLISKDDYIFYKDEDNKYYLVNYIGTWMDLVLPTDIEGYSYEINQYAFCNYIGLTNIIIPDSVTSIGFGAFTGCSSLTSITIPFVGASLNESENTHFGYIFGAESDYNNSKYVPSSLKEVVITGGTSINQYAFYNCSSLTNITIPDSVTSIGYYAFEGCSSLTSITIPFVGAALNGSNTYFGYIFGSSYSDNSKYVPNSLKEVVITGGKSIGGGAFEDCSSLTNITIPDSVTSIGGSAFKDCSGLANITIPDSVTSIGSSAFSGCSSLTNITIPESLTSISYSAFSGCSSLTTIVIPGSVTSIEQNAFSNCSSLTSVTIPGSVTSIGFNFFDGCGKLTNVYYEGTLENWCNIHFNNASCNPMNHANHFYTKNSSNQWEEVTSIEIPTTITEIGNCQFYGFNNVTSITIPNSVTSISSSAFSRCSSLATIVIPNSVTSISSSAFSECSSLTSITIPFVGASLNGTSHTQFGWIFGAISSNDNSSYVPTSLKEVVITGGTSLGDSAFSGCNSLTSVTIPNSITSLGDSVFSGCSSLTSVTIPNSVTSIGDFAFSGCSSLISITIPSVNNTYFGSFFGASSYKENSNYVPSGLKEVVITGGTSINQYAFYNCSNLTNITIPDSVTSIGSSAFSGCGNLINVYYEGTIKNWCNIRLFYSSSIPSGSSNPMYCASHFYLRNSNNDWEEVTSIEIPDTITKIGDCQFYGFKNVTSITVPDSVTSIGEYAFSNCYRLVEIYNLSSLNITNAKVIHTSLEEASKLIEKENYVFYKENEDKYYLVGYKGKDTELVLPNDIEGHTYEINNYAFYDCSNLTSIIIPNGITSIGENAFFNCHSLTSIIIPDSVTSIEYSAFWHCISLTSIVIPNSVTSIGSSAFRDCYRLVEVYNLSSINITIGSSSNGYIGYYAKVIHTSLEEASKLIEKENYVFFKENENKYYLVGYKGNDTELVLPNDIEDHTYEIYQSAFWDCSSFTSVTIPDSVTSIGNTAFKNCSSLTNVYYEGTMENWCNIAFDVSSYCYSNPMYYASHFYLRNSNNEWEEVTNIEIPNTITEIGAYQFYGFKNVTSITIPNSVTSIGSYAFYDCNKLTSVTIGNGVTSIGLSAFWNCSSLKEVYYLGTSAEWSNISIGSNNSELISATIYYYSEVQPTESGNYWHYVDGVVTKW